MPGETAMLGQSYGCYQTVCLLGGGGVAEVYKAIHQITEEIVALKCLRPRHIANHFLRERMIAEAKLLLGLRHANVVRVYDVGVDAGVLWMAMELLSGVTLRALARELGALPVATALYYAREIADGVSALHEMRVIHRDLKPENIMITDQNEVKVLDMGAAKFYDAGFPQTMAGVVCGTPLYMSPEHVQGDGVDVRTDVYSLGMLLYELIAGAHPFLSENGKPLGRFDICERQLQVTPRPLASIVKACPDFVSDFVQASIAKEKSARPSSMSDFAREVRRILQRVIETAHTLPALPEISQRRPLLQARRGGDAGRQPGAAPVTAAKKSADSPTSKADPAQVAARSAPAAPESEDSVGEADSDNDATLVFARVPSPQFEISNPIILYPRANQRGQPVALDRGVTDNGTVIMPAADGATRPYPPRNQGARAQVVIWPAKLGHELVPRGPLPRSRAPADNPIEMPAPGDDVESLSPSIPPDPGLDGFFSRSPAAVLRRGVLLERSLQVLLGTVIVALALLFAFSRRGSNEQRGRDPQEKSADDRRASTVEGSRK